MAAVLPEYKKQKQKQIVQFEFYFVKSWIKPKTPECFPCVCNCVFWSSPLLFLCEAHSNSLHCKKKTTILSDYCNELERIADTSHISPTSCCTSNHVVPVQSMTCRRTCLKLNVCINAMSKMRDHKPHLDFIIISVAWDTSLPIFYIYIFYSVLELRTTIVTRRNLMHGI